MSFTRILRNGQQVLQNNIYLLIRLLIDIQYFDEIKAFGANIAKIFSQHVDFPNILTGKYPIRIWTYEYYPLVPASRLVAESRSTIKSWLSIILGQVIPKVVKKNRRDFNVRFYISVSDFHKSECRTITRVLAS